MMTSTAYSLSSALSTTESMGTGRRTFAHAIACMLVAMSVAGCGPSRPDSATLPPYDLSALNGANALRQVTDFLAVGPRPAGSEGARGAAEYLARRMKEYGLAVSVDEFTEASGNTNIVFRNVLGTITGRSARTVVLASHYDTKAGISPTFIGANDSGSSTGLLLELARLLAAMPDHRHTIVCAFLDGEECVTRYGPTDGLHGSKRLAAELADPERPSLIAAVIVLDMVGDSDLTVTIPRNSSPELVSAAFEAAHDNGTRSMFSLSRIDILDDHVPFRQAGIPAIDIIDFQFGSAPGKNDYWHTDQDTIDKIDANSLEVVGRVTLGMLNKIGR